MREVTKMGPRVCCVKLGDRGAISYDRLTGEVFCVPAYDSQVVDVTGCGDSFVEAFCQVMSLIKIFIMLWCVELFLHL